MQIVAIGASAGGIEAFRLFFENMPADSGMGFVVVLHLSADRKSLLAQIISRWTTMSVSEAADGDSILPNQVYVIPPGNVATMQHGRLRLRHVAVYAPREMAPIDEFFGSLADAVGDNAIGIVLSGTGHDGTLGLKAIKARGGLTLAQGSDGSAPQYSGMPESAIATGAVDLIAPVQDMPGLVMGSNPDADAPAAAESAEQIETARLRICAILRASVGHDFSQYKDKTFLRRVHRRTQVLGFSALAGYVTRLADDHDEVLMLFRDLLIGVTAFFRDADAFEAVAKLIVPRLFEGKGANDAVRVWVPGCATGEEAYSLAILLREYMDKLSVVPKVQIFATDIDEPAIASARSGRYPATLLEGLSQGRRERFFSRTESSYLVTKEIRDLCTFSAHSLVRDPPFSRMNLVSCRNLLIYMDAELQGNVVPAFHYSLVPGGLLLLGSSETVSRYVDLFAPLDKEHRVFQRRDGTSPPLKIPTRFGQTSRPAASAATASGGSHGESRTDWTKSLAVAATRVLERFASPYVVVTEDGNVAYYSSHVGSVLQPALGPPSRSLFDMVRRGLRHSARAALRTAIETGRPVEQMVPADVEGSRPVTLIVEPLPGQEPDRPFLVIFKEDGAAGSALARLPEGAPKLGLTTELERENRDLRERLQSLS